MSSASFIGVFQFAVHRFFPSLIKFIPKYFILFDAIVNGIVFLISLPGGLLSVYRNAHEFSVLIFFFFNPATFLDLSKKKT